MKLLKPIVSSSEPTKDWIEVDEIYFDLTTSKWKRCTSINPMTFTDISSPAGEAFPIGSVFLAIVATNPNTLLGYGTWSQIAQGQFLVGQKATDTDFDVAEETGGAKTHAHADHAELTHSGTVVDAHPPLTHTKITSTKHYEQIGADSSYDAHGSQTHTVTQPNVHAAQSHDSPSHLPPYFVAYIWRRDA